MRANIPKKDWNRNNDLHAYDTSKESRRNADPKEHARTNPNNVTSANTTPCKSRNPTFGPRREPLRHHRPRDAAANTTSSSSIMCRIRCMNVFHLGMVLCWFLALYVNHSYNTSRSRSSETTTTTRTEEDRLRVSKQQFFSFLSSSKIRTRKLDARNILFENEGIQAAAVINNDESHILPTWEEVSTLYGNEAIIYGIENEETCHRFTIDPPTGMDPSEMMVGTAGIYHSDASNVLGGLLVRNCRLRLRMKKKGTPGIRFQVPWGEIHPPSNKTFRDTYRVPGVQGVDSESVIPIVTIKDPYSWMQSICEEQLLLLHQQQTGKTNPSFLRFHDPIDHCNLTTPITVNYPHMQKQYPSLVHMWNDWYEEYIHLEYPLPIIIVRYEDLFYHTEVVLKSVCECIGGQLPMNRTLAYMIGKGNRRYNDTTLDMTTTTNPPPPTTTTTTKIDMSYGFIEEFIATVMDSTSHFVYENNKDEKDKPNDQHPTQHALTNQSRRNILVVSANENHPHEEEYEEDGDGGSHTLFTIQDLEYAKKHLNPMLMNMFGYKHPSTITTTPATTTFIHRGIPKHHNYHGSRHNTNNNNNNDTIHQADTENDKKEDTDTTGKEFSISELLQQIEAYQRNGTTTRKNNDNYENVQDYYKELLDKQFILDLLNDAGFEMIDEDIYEQLPKWSDISTMYGTEPMIHGLDTDTCEEFQTGSYFQTRGKVYDEDKQKYMGPAGMFNTGTNLLANLIRRNCQIRPRILRDDHPLQKMKHNVSDPELLSKRIISTQLFLKSSGGMLFQVPWGKHNPIQNETFRTTHKTPKQSADVTADYVLPIVCIRDPYRWMQSMCRHRYSSNWMTSDHCPNLVIRKHDIQAHPFLGKLKQPSFPVRVRFQKDMKEKYPSMVHFWNEWNDQYFSKATFPRVMVRFEDLLFHPKYVTEKICECAGGEMPKKRNGKFSYQVNAAKKASRAHGNSTTGFIEALVRYGSPQGRYDGYQIQDLEFAKEQLNPTIMDYFRYQYLPYTND